MTPEPLSEEPMTEEELSEIEARIAVVCGAPGPSVIRALIAEIRRLHLQVERLRCALHDSEKSDYGQCAYLLDPGICGHCAGTCGREHT